VTPLSREQQEALDCVRSDAERQEARRVGTSDPLTVPWKVGPGGRTIYREDDGLGLISLGRMDTDECAAHVVALHNASLRPQP
jgi:hypothetical protein